MGLLEGRTALVTGGGSGIGRAVVDAFVREGARVVVLEVVAERIPDLEQAHDDQVTGVVGDATSWSANQSAVALALERYGRLDCLVCCVGIWDYFASIQTLEPDQLDAAFQEIMDVNVKSYMLATKAAWDALVESNGSVIYTLSNSSFYPNGGGPLYIASKWATRGLVVEMAFELAPRVRVNGVAPGGTLTNLRGLRSLGQEGLRLRETPGIEDLMRQGNPLQLVLNPEDHAGAYLYLASPELSRGVTGTVIHSDGGLGVRGIARLAGLLT